MATIANGAIVPMTFQFDALPVRTVNRDGETWFVAADVATALDYGRAPDMVRLLDEDEKGVQIMHTPGGPQSLSVVSESGLFHAVFKSRSEAAARFRRWVTGEVLPAIRKTGAYGAPAAPVPEVPTITIPMVEYVGLLQSKVRHLEGKPARARAPQRPVTAAERAEVSRLRALGMSLTDIAKHLKRSRATVSYLLRAIELGREAPYGTA